MTIPVSMSVCIFAKNVARYFVVSAGRSLPQWCLESAGRLGMMRMVTTVAGSLMTKVWLIEWIDSVTHAHGWQPMETAKDCNACPIKTVGFIIGEDSESITLSPTIQRFNGEYLTCITIPRGCIKRKKVIYRVEPVKKKVKKSGETKGKP